MRNRRELLKLFAAGTVIAPLGAINEPARLIEPPKVEAVELSAGLPPKLDLSEIRSARLALTMKDGTARTLNLDGLYPSGISQGEVRPTAVQLSFQEPASPRMDLGFYRVTMDASGLPPITEPKQ